MKRRERPGSALRGAPGERSEPGPAGSISEHAAPRTENGRRWLWRGAQILLIAAVTWGVYRSIGPELARLAWADLTELRPSFGRVGISLVLLVGVYLAHALLWRRIMTDLAVAKPSLRDTIRVYFVASLGRYLPGKLWQLAGLALLSSRAGWSAGGAAAAAVLGQLGFLTTGLLFLGFLLPRWTGGTTALLAALLLTAAALAAWALFTAPHAGRARAWLIERGPAAFQPKLMATFALAARIQPRMALTWGIGYGLSWVVLGIAFTTFVAAFVPEAAASSRHLAGTIAAAYLWGYVIMIVPAGLGVREIAMSGLLAQLPGFPVGAVLLVPVLSRLWFTTAELLPLLMLPFLPGRAPRDPETEAH